MAEKWILGKGVGEGRVDGVYKVNMNKLPKKCPKCERELRLAHGMNGTLICVSCSTFWAERWGRPYGGERNMLTGDGRRLTLRRRGQRCRWYDGARQVGPELANVAPALAYAEAQGWRSS